MRISAGELFGKFILSEGQIKKEEIALKKADLAIFLKIKEGR